MAQICPVTHSFLKPGNHHPIWWNSSEGSFYLRSPLIGSNHCVSDKLFTLPQSLPDLTPLFIQPTAHDPSLLTPLLLKNPYSLIPLSFHCCHLEKLNTRLIQLSVFLAPTSRILNMGTEKAFNCMD